MQDFSPVVNGKRVKCSFEHIYIKEIASENQMIFKSVRIEHS